MRCSTISLALILVSPHALAGTTRVTWQSPSTDSIINAGELFKAQWTSTQDIVSPSFKVCPCSSGAISARSKHDDEEEEEGEESSNDSEDIKAADRESKPSSEEDSTSAVTGNCGASVWPEVVAGGDGSFSASLSAPPMSENSCFFILMSDDFGTKQRSPHFYVSSSATTNATMAATTASVSAAAVLPSSSTITPNVAQPNGAQVPLGSSPSPSTPPVALPYVPQAPQTQPNLLASRVQPPKAAIAIPLSFAGAILLLAALMGYRHHRKLREARIREESQLRATQYGSGKVGGGDIEKALEVLSKNNMPLPLYMPHSNDSQHTQVPARKEWEREVRQPTRRPWSALRPCDSVSRHGSSYGPSPGLELYDSSSTPLTDMYNPSHRSSRSSSRPHSRASNSYDDRRSDRSRASSRTRVSHSSRRYVHRDEALEEEEESATGSVLGGYTSEQDPRDRMPECLMPEPQRAHIRREADRDVERYEDMDEIDFYDCVRDVLRGRR